MHKNLALLQRFCARHKAERVSLITSSKRRGGGHDIETARNAGSAVFCVPYGYNEGEPVKAADCDALVQTLEEGVMRASDEGLAGARLGSSSNAGVAPVV